MDSGIDTKVTFWVCGLYKGETDDGCIIWHIQGVFTTLEKAIAACHNDKYFVGPMILDESLPHKEIEWVGCEYPLAK